MKRFTLSVLATLLIASGSSYAQSNKLSDVGGKTRIAAQAPASGRLNKNTDSKNTQGVAIHKAPRKQATSSSTTPTDVKNTEVYSVANGNVSGTLHERLFKSASGYEMGWFMPSYYDLSGLTGQYMLDEEKGEIYIYSPITNYNSFSYIKGSIDKDGNVTVECPQYLAGDPDDEDPWAYYVMNAEMNEQHTSFIPVEKDLNLHFKLENGTLSLCEGSQIGLFEWGAYYYYDEEKDDYIYPENTYAYMWLDYVDLTQSMRVFEEEGVSPGKELTTEKWTVAYNGMDSYGEFLTAVEVMEIEACIDDNTFWVKGLLKNVPDAWIKGEISDDKVIFRKSFIAYDEKYGYFEFLLTGINQYDEAEEMYVLNRTEELVLDFDPETKTITGKDGASLIVNGGDTSIYYLHYWINPLIFPYAEKPIAKPMTPMFGVYYPAEDGYDAFFSFTMSTADVNYNQLDTSYMFYEILFDGEPYEFTVEDLGDIYSDVAADDETFSQFPWDFDSDNLYSNNGEWCLSFGVSGFDTIGVRSFYISSDDEYYYSDPMIYDVNTGTVTNGVNTVNNAKEAVNRFFTSIDGKRISKPEKGIVLETTVYSDGSHKTVKRMVR